MESRLLAELAAIYGAARESDDGERCMVSMAPDLRENVKAEMARIAATEAFPAAATLRISEPRHPGFNDGTIFPPDMFPLGTAPSMIRAAAADRAPPRGTVRVIVVLADFSDRAMARPAQEFRDLFFSVGVLPNRSVREYFREVTNGLVDIQGEVVGPFRMPRTLAAYANGASGTGSASPNARTLALDAATAANATVNFGPYDNDGNGIVDAYIVIHAGRGAEETGAAGDIWSHKWVLPGSGLNVDGTRIFPYLTVPEDCRIGVCAHELGHLLFGFPDLYDTDNTSEGVGNWCLMGSGSWGLGGDRPTHPSAWCKVNQGWVTVDNRTTNGAATIPDVKSSHTVLRLWKDGAPGTEYFLVENRQQTSFDASLPGGGLLIWHIDETQTSNSNENRYKVGLKQADGLRQLETNVNRGDAGDAYPGPSGNTSFNGTSTPSSKSHDGADTCVAVTGISASGATMTANIQVRCGKAFLPKEAKVEKIEVKEKRETKEVSKREAKELLKRETKELKTEKREFEKPGEKGGLGDKRPEKPVIDKSVGLDKGFAEKPGEGRPGDFGRPGRSGRGAGRSAALEARIDELEALVEAIAGRLSGAAEGGMADYSGSGADTGGPFIGSELRPDLSQGALLEEEDFEQLREQMRGGAAGAKRLYDGAGPR